MNPISKKWLLYSLPGILGLMILTMYLCRPTPDRERVREKGASNVEEPQGNSEEAIGARVREDLIKDRTYKGALNSVDKDFIDALEGVSDQQKEEMWKRVQAAQAEARKLREETASPK